METHYGVKFKVYEEKEFNNKKMLCWIPFILLSLAEIIKRFKINYVLTNIVFTIGFLSMILILCDNKYGTDIPNYEEYFKIIDKEGEYIFIELFYKYIMIFIKYYVINSFPFFMFVITSFVLCSFLVTVKKYSIDAILSTLIFYCFYFYLYPASGLRQSLALGFTMVSLFFIYNKNAKMYYLTLILAFLSHYSAIFFLPCYYIANKLEISEKKAILIVLICFPLMLFDFTKLIALFIGEFAYMNHYTELYLDSNAEFSEKVNVGVGVFVKILFFILYAKTYKKEDRIQKLLFNIYFVYLCLYFPLSSVAIISSRGLDYYKIFDTIILTYIISNIKYPLYRFLYVSFLYLYLIYSLNVSTRNYDRFPSLLDSLL